MDWDIFMVETKTKAHVSLMSKCFKHALISFCNYGGEVPWFGILVIEWVPKVIQILTWPNCGKQLSISIDFEKSGGGPFTQWKIWHNLYGKGFCNDIHKGPWTKKPILM